MTLGDVYELAHGFPATTKFGGSDAEFALPYQIAISMLTTKVRILEQEFTGRERYGPVDAISSRIKTHDSIVAKAQRVCCPLTADDIRTNILDIAGVRITCGRVSDAYRIAARISDLPDVTVAEVEDYIAKPKRDGYKSLHMIVEIPVRLSNRVRQVPVEVQIRTIAEDLRASQSTPPVAMDRCRPPRRTVPVKPATHGKAPSQLPRAYLPQPVGPKAAGRQIFSLNHNAPVFDSTGFQR
jgi:Region found in RelA / SpoT proteins